MLSPRGKKELKINQRRILINSIEIGIPAPEQVFILGQRHTSNGKVVGRVRNSKTLNYKSFTPHRDGLFCERIFGPVQSYICACGKQGPLTTSKGTLKFCPRCEVEYTDQRARRYRVGYIGLVSPVTHIWHLKGRPSYVSLFLGKRKKTLATLAYCNDYLVEQSFSKVNVNGVLSCWPITTSSVEQHRVIGADFFKDRILKGLNESKVIKGLTLSREQERSKVWSPEAGFTHGSLSNGAGLGQSPLRSVSASFLKSLRSHKGSTTPFTPSSVQGKRLTRASLLKKKGFALAKPLSSQKKDTLSYTRSQTLPFLPTFICEFHLRDGLLSFFDTFPPAEDIPIPVYCKVPRRYPLRDVHKFMADQAFSKVQGASHLLTKPPVLFGLRLGYRQGRLPKQGISSSRSTATFIDQHKDYLKVNQGPSTPYTQADSKSSLSLTRAMLESGRLSLTRGTLESGRPTQTNNSLASRPDLAFSNRPTVGNQSRNKTEGFVRRSYRNLDLGLAAPNCPKVGPPKVGSPKVGYRALALRASDDNKTEGPKGLPPGEGAGFVRAIDQARLSPKAIDGSLSKARFSSGVQVTGGSGRRPIRGVSLINRNDVCHTSLSAVNEKRLSGPRLTDQRSVRQVLLSIILDRIVTTLIGLTPILGTSSNRPVLLGLVNRPFGAIADLRSVTSAPTVVMARRVGSRVSDTTITKPDTDQNGSALTRAKLEFWAWPELNRAITGLRLALSAKPGRGTNSRFARVIGGSGRLRFRDRLSLARSATDNYVIGLTRAKRSQNRRFCACARSANKAQGQNKNSRFARVIGAGLYSAQLSKDGYSRFRRKDQNRLEPNKARLERSLFTSEGYRQRRLSRRLPKVTQAGPQTRASLLKGYEAGFVQGNHVWTKDIFNRREVKRLNELSKAYSAQLSKAGSVIISTDDQLTTGSVGNSNKNFYSSKIVSEDFKSWRGLAKLPTFGRLPNAVWLPVIGESSTRLAIRLSFVDGRSGLASLSKEHFEESLPSSYKTYGFVRATTKAELWLAGRSKGESVEDWLEYWFDRWLQNWVKLKSQPLTKSKVLFTTAIQNPARLYKNREVFVKGLNRLEKSAPTVVMSRLHFCKGSNNISISRSRSFSKSCRFYSAARSMARRDNGPSAKLAPPSVSDRRSLANELPRTQAENKFSVAPLRELSVVQPVGPSFVEAFGITFNSSKDQGEGGWPLGQSPEQNLRFCYRHSREARVRDSRPSVGNFVGQPLNANGNRPALVSELAPHLATDLRTVWRSQTKVTSPARSYALGLKDRYTAPFFSNAQIAGIGLPLGKPGFACSASGREHSSRWSKQNLEIQSMRPLPLLVLEVDAGSQSLPLPGRSRNTFLSALQKRPNSSYAQTKPSVLLRVWAANPRTRASLLKGYEPSGLPLGKPFSKRKEGKETTRLPMRSVGPKHNIASYLSRYEQRVKWVKREVLSSFSFFGGGRDQDFKSAITKPIQNRAITGLFEGLPKSNPGRGTNSRFARVIGGSGQSHRDFCKATTKPEILLAASVLLWPVCFANRVLLREAKSGREEKPTIIVDPRAGGKGSSIESVSNIESQVWFPEVVTIFQVSEKVAFGRRIAVWGTTARVGFTKPKPDLLSKGKSGWVSHKGLNESKPGRVFYRSAIDSGRYTEQVNQSLSNKTCSALLSKPFRASGFVRTRASLPRTSSRPELHPASSNSLTKASRPEPLLSEAESRLALVSELSVVMAQFSYEARARVLQETETESSRALEMGLPTVGRLPLEEKLLSTEEKENSNNKSLISNGAFSNRPTVGNQSHNKTRGFVSGRNTKDSVTGAAIFSESDAPMYKSAIEDEISFGLPTKGRLALGNRPSENQPSENQPSENQQGQPSDSLAQPNQGQGYGNFADMVTNEERYRGLLEHNSSSKAGIDSYMQAQLDLKAIQEVLSYTGGGALRELLRCFDTQAFSVILLNEIKLLREYHKGYLIYDYDLGSVCRTGFACSASVREHSSRWSKQNLDRPLLGEPGRLDKTELERSSSKAKEIDNHADYENEDDYEELPEEINRFSRSIHRNARRLKIVQLLMRNNRRPEWMLISALPVLPPDLRPILQMSENLIVASDLNTLYQRVIYRNNRQYKLRIVEWSYATSLQRLVQDAVDRLIENGKGGSKPFLTPGGRPLKSLSDTLKGKKGRFRLNLLGKRVDFSGRSVIVVSPHLKIHECGLPREMALELYQYLLIRQMLLKRQVSSVIIAKRVIRQQKAFVWDTLRELIYHHPLLLNRAPTLHRLGIQAFQPKLVLGSTILLHPLVCAGFNADFDGDQMGVHLPLCDEARAEAWDLLWSRNNLLSPATGEPILLPSQDMVLGFYHMTALLPSIMFGKPNPVKVTLYAKPSRAEFDQRSTASIAFGDSPGSGFVMAGARPTRVRTPILSEKGLRKPHFFSPLDVVRAYQNGDLDIHTPIWLQWNGKIENDDSDQTPLEVRINSFGVSTQLYPSYKFRKDASSKSAATFNLFIRTTPGRVIVNNIFPLSTDRYNNAN